MSIYTDLVAAGVTISDHQGDLYALVTPASAAIVQAYEFKARVTRFRSDDPADNGAAFYDIPFAYDPFWNTAEPEEARVISEEMQRTA